jgi:hypothetical protein
VDNRKTAPRARRGVALVLAIIFMAIFTCLAVGVATTARCNMVLSRNRINTQQALAIGQSGVCLMLRGLGNLDVSDAADATALRQALGQKLKTVLAASSMLNANNITWDAGGVHVPTATVTRADGSSGQFDTIVQADGGAVASTTITVTCIGRFGGASRTVTYKMAPKPGPSLLVHYGIATKGSVGKNAGCNGIVGLNNPAEASVCLGSYTADPVLDLRGNAGISGDVTVSNSAGVVTLKGGGHVDGTLTVGANVSWDVVDITPFTPYVSSTRTSGSAGAITLSNVRIPPNTNPTFTGAATINGVMYIQSPNKVTFSNTCTITGVIVCDKPATKDYTKNQLLFDGDVRSYGVEQLPAGSQYDGLRNLKGSSILADGYNVYISSSSTGLAGMIACSQLDIDALKVKVGIYITDDTAIGLHGNRQIVIDKSGESGNPTGMRTSTATLTCVSGSYSE